MKVSHILEAAPALDLRNQEVDSRLRIKREGDMVWHLYRFFDEGEEHTVVGDNPAYQKLEKELEKQTLAKLTPKEQKGYHDYYDTKTSSGIGSFETARKVQDYMRDSIKGLKGRLPEERIPVAAGRRFYPKPNLVVAVRKGDSEIPIRWLTVRIKNGEIKSISFESKSTGTRDSKQFRVKQSQKIDPRQLFVVYQKLDY